MITISLNQIKAHNPCDDGWETILAARGGDNADYDEQFPLSSALDSNGLDDVIWALRCLPEHYNLWRKYAVWCARQVEDLMKDERSKDAVDVAWRYSEGQATVDELKAAWAAAGDAAAAGAAAAGAGAAADAADSAAWYAASAARAAGAAAAGAWYAASAARVATRDAQAEKLREILDSGKWI